MVDASTAGVSGDMFVGAVVDLGASKDKVTKAALAVKKRFSKCSHLTVRFQKTTINGFASLRLKINATETGTETSAHELSTSLDRTLSILSLSEEAKKFSKEALGTLIRAEGKLHGNSVNRNNGGSTHFHEAGSIDTLIDIVGVATGLDDLGLFNDTDVFCTPIAVGGGTFSFSHGRVSSPAPATLEIARASELSIMGGPVKAELATPTGMAIISALPCKSTKFYPPMKPIKVGLGAGNKTFSKVPNILRLVLGEKVED